MGYGSRLAIRIFVTFLGAEQAFILLLRTYGTFNGRSEGGIAPSIVGMLVMTAFLDWRSASHD